VVVPDQHPKVLAVDRRECVDVGLLAYAPREHFLERPGAAAFDGNSLPAEAPEELESIEDGEVNAVRGERAVAGEVGSIRKRERPAEHSTQVHVLLGSHVERAFHHHELVGTVGG